MDFKSLAASIVGRRKTQSPTYENDPLVISEKPVSETRARKASTTPQTDEDSYFEGLRREEDESMSRMNTDLENWRQIQREKLEAKQKPIDKVPAWKRMLAGALQSIGQKNPNSSWGEILGSGIGGAAVNGVSPKIYEQGERIRRNSRIDAEYEDREAAARGDLEFDAKVAEIARRRTDIAGRDADRRANRENQKANIENQKIYREGVIRNQQERNDEVKTNNERKARLSEQKMKNDEAFREATIKWRDEGRKIQWDSLKETKAMHEYQRAQSRGVSTTDYSIEVQVNGETRFQRVPVPDDVQDVKAYIEETYSPTSAVAKGAAKTIKPGVQGKSAGKGKGAANRLSARDKEVNESSTYKPGFVK